MESLWAMDRIPQWPRSSAACTARRCARVVPIPPVLVRMLRRHLRQSGTTPDGRLFRSTRGGMLCESVYGRA